MKKYIGLLSGLLLTCSASAQLSIGNSGLSINSGSIFSSEGLVLTPSTNITLTNTTLNLSVIPLSQGGTFSILKVYSFTTPVSYSGNIGIKYEASDLNGNAEDSLEIAYTSITGGALNITSGSITGTPASYFVSNTVSGAILADVSAIPPPLSSSMSQSNVTCFGGNDGSATALVSGGTLPYTYSWTPYGGNAATATGLIAGMYIVTISDAASRTIYDTVIITEPSGAATTWTGAVSAAWNVSGNWTCGVPSSSSKAIIPDVVNDPVVGSGITATVGKIELQAGSLLSLQTGSILEIEDSIFFDDTNIDATHGLVIMNGSVAQSLPSNAFVGKTIDSLNSGNSFGVTLDDTLNITGSLSVVSGTFNTNNQLILKSSVAGDASIAPVGGTINGKATVERYIPAAGRRAWRIMAVPVSATNAPTIHDCWQEGGNATAGYGTHITQAGGAGVTGSWDAGISSASSIRQYNPATNQLSSPAGTNISVASQDAWFLFIRGDRTININSIASSSNTTIRTTGNLKTGDQDYTVGINQFAMIGNPYAAPIDFAAAIANAATTGVLDKFWIWDTKLGTNGSYVVFDAGLGYLPTVTGGSYNAATSIIQSGQGFFVKSNGSTGNFRVDELDKAGTYQNVFKTTTGNDPMIRIKLNINNPASPASYLPADGTIAAFNNNYTASVDGDDAVKMTNFGPNLALVRNSTNLSVEKRPDITTNDTLFATIWNASTGNYQLEVEPINFGNTNLTPHLIDRFLNTITPLSAATVNYYNFSTTSVTASQSDRFEIVFQNTTPLLDNNIKLMAERRQIGVAIKWQSHNEANISGYSLERSNDGKNFTGIWNVPTNATGNYAYKDLNVSAEDIYYRVKANGKDLKSFYSNTIKLSGKNSSGTITANNPVASDKITLHFTNIEGGQYQAGLYDVTGRLVYIKTIAHEGDSAVVLLQAPEIHGMYTLKIVGNNSVFTQKLIRQ